MEGNKPGKFPGTSRFPFQFREDFPLSSDRRKWYPQRIQMTYNYRAPINGIEPLGLRHPFVIKSIVENVLSDKRYF